MTKFLDMSELKALEEDKLKEAEILKFVLEKVDNIVGKGQNASNLHFIGFPQCFLPYEREILSLGPHFNCCLQMLSIWTSLRFCHVIKS